MLCSSSFDRGVHSCTSFFCVKKYHSSYLTIFDNKDRSMKKTYYLLTLIIVLFSFVSNAQNKDESFIRAILAKQSMAWNQGNIEGFMKGYWENDSLLFIGKKGLTYGWTNTLNNYKKNYPDAVSMGQLTFIIIKVKPLSAKYQEVIGKWHLTRKEGDLEGHFTLLFQKIKGKWYIVMDHSS